ncbi:MAG: plasmid partitioning protein RepB C-terminal domain-containing protein [Verrucomicrobiota bacterium]
MKRKSKNKKATSRKIKPAAPSSHAPAKAESGNGAKIAFEMRKVELPLDRILPMRVVKNPGNLRRYRTILTSMPEVGLVEPLVVHPQRNQPNTYLLLDGHLRYLALKQLGKIVAECIIANDDEGFTYNARVNRLPPIQCHKMIVKAVRNGVKPERIAAALDMPLSVVRGLITLLDGIHEEAAEMLRDKNVTAKTIRLLKKATGLRQIEIAELMGNANNYTAGYAEALILGTRTDQLVNPAAPKEKAGLTPEAVAKMEREMESLERDFKAIEATYTENMMSLTLARSYLRKLLKNAKVVRFLNTNYADLYSELETMATAEGL